MRIVVAGSGVLELGKQGENLATQIRFPITDWIESHGEGTFQLLHKRRYDSDAQPVVVTQDEQYVYWNVKSSDVAYDGYGRCELLYYVNNVLAKSEDYVTQVIPEEIAPGGSTPPEPWESWVDEVLEAGAKAKQSADAAKVSETNAESAASEAGGYVETAKGYAEDAQRTSEAAQAALNGVNFVSFDLEEDGDLYIYNSERLGTTAFSLDNDGDLEVEI